MEIKEKSNLEEALDKSKKLAKEFDKIRMLQKIMNCKLIIIKGGGNSVDLEKGLDRLFLIFLQSVTEKSEQLILELEQEFKALANNS